MNFNNHSNLEGQHAFLGASKYHWINYGEDKVAEAYRNFLATQKGTVLHAFAAQCIMLNQKLPKSKQTLNMYVNDEFHCGRYFNALWYLQMIRMRYQHVKLLLRIGEQCPMPI